jgi:cob(I)alamin adenosyltransferase
MRRKQVVVERTKAQATRDQGILLVNTGNGKGKSSAALGLAARALGNGMRVGVVQFIKGREATGEQLFFRDQPGIDFHVMGEGFTWDTQDRSRDIATTTRAWERALAFLQDPAYGLVILDELNIVLKHGYLPLEPVLEAACKRPAMQHLVITGRGAPQALIEAADTVTEMRNIKHAYKSGVRAQRGMEL